MILADLTHKHSKLQFSQTELLRQVSLDVYGLSWWRCASLMTLTRISLSLTSLSLSAPRCSPFPHLEPSQSFDKETAINRLDASPAAYDTSFHFDAVSITPPCRAATLILARLDARILSFTRLLREYECCGSYAGKKT